MVAIICYDMLGCMLLYTFFMTDDMVHIMIDDTVYDVIYGMVYV